LRPREAVPAGTVNAGAAAPAAPPASSRVAMSADAPDDGPLADARGVVLDAVADALEAPAAGTAGAELDIF